MSVIEERSLGNEIKVYYLPLATQAEWCFSMNLRQFLALYEGHGRVSADKYVQVNRQVHKDTHSSAGLTLSLPSKSFPVPFSKMKWARTVLWRKGRSTFPLTSAQSTGASV